MNTALCKIAIDDALLIRFIEAGTCALLKTLHQMGGFGYSTIENVTKIFFFCIPTVLKPP